MSQDDVFTSENAFMEYYSNKTGSSSGHRFYNKTTKILEITDNASIHQGTTSVLCGDSNLRSGFQFTNSKLNEVSLLFKSDITDTISDSSIVVSNPLSSVKLNSGKMVITTSDLQTSSTSFIQNINSSINTTTYDSLIQTKKYKLDASKSNTADVTTVIQSSVLNTDNTGSIENKCSTMLHSGIFNTRCNISKTGIIDYNDALTNSLSTTYKTNNVYTNVADATIVVFGSKSNKENSGVMYINSGNINIGTNTDVLSACNINIGSTLSTITIKGSLIFENSDLTATNLPDFIRQIVRSRI